MIYRLALLAITLLTLESSAPPTNAISKLQQEIDSGARSLQFDPKGGYLQSLLKELKIPVDSQVLVYSKTSFQRDLISPERPRAVYFNDDVYVGSVQEAPVLEISVADPVSGPLFYTLDQEQTGRPKFEHRTTECIQCHGTGMLTDGLPGHMMRSVFTDNNGGPILSSGSFVTSDQSPLSERWGGWYFTGSLGKQANMGRGLNAGEGAVHVDTTKYLSPSSDAVALMVLAHQTRVHNYIAELNAVTRMFLASRTTIDEETTNRIHKTIEPAVRAMLFVDEAGLTEPMSGSSGFRVEFEKRGPYDRQGRSLRQFDLTKRLFRYPFSYLIYSDAFDALLPPVKDAIYQRILEVLSGKERAEAFNHLSATDRKAILEILRDTKPDFAREL